MFIHRYIAASLLSMLWVCSAPAQDKKSDRLEKSVNRALKYLHGVQDSDGAWRLNTNKNVAATSLAVMAFLSAGHVPGEGPYGKAIAKGIRWVVKHPVGVNDSNNPYFPTGAYTMYERGISTLMLAEVVGMTDAKLSPLVKKALEREVRLILKGQRQKGVDAGGWRYQLFGNDADVSVTGWQLMALKAAKNVGCDVPAERIEMAVKFLRRCRDARSGGFCYRPGAQLTVACTGTAILCLELCDKHHSADARRAGSYLLKHPPRWNTMHFFYSIYYCSQATFQLGGNYWAFYRPRLHEVLMEHQHNDGRWSGSFGFGPAYSTSMGVLALTVEYRFLPIYQRGDDSKEKKKSP